MILVHHLKSSRTPPQHSHRYLSIPTPKNYENLLLEHVELPHVLDLILVTALVPWFQGSGILGLGNGVRARQQTNMPQL